MRRVLPFIAGAILFVSTASGKSLDSVNRSDRAAWNCIKTIAVRPFPVTGEFKGPKSQEEYMQCGVPAFQAVPSWRRRPRG